MRQPLPTPFTALLLWALCTLAAMPAGAKGALAMQAMAPPANAVAPPGQLGGRLQLSTLQELTLTVLRDDHGLASQPALALDSLPLLDATYLQVDGDLVPRQRGLVTTGHPHWDWLLEPGRVWQDADGSRHISLPFALQEKNANCTHNGVLRARLGANGEAFPVTVLMASETCQYLQFNLEGSLKGRFYAEPVADAQAIAAGHRRLLAARLPTRPLSALFAPGDQAGPAALAGPGQHLSAWGLASGDTHYVSDCPTRRGPYPHCDFLSLPSYSLAKSLVGGLGLMRMEQRAPGSRTQRIARLIPACAQVPGWDAVTVGDALNMQTGHYASAAPQADEASEAMSSGFFLPSRHTQKLRFACGGWPRRGPPGGTFVYHTSDTYLVGAALNALLAQHTGQPGDFYDALLRPLWRALALSPSLDTTRRSAGAGGQPFTGYGLTLLRDDIVRLGQALTHNALAHNTLAHNIPTHNKLAPQLDATMLRQALQQEPEQRGAHPAQAPGIYYQHGFWGYDATRLLGCSEQRVIPFLSGYGGISVLLLPDGRVYYAFGDGGQFAFADALRWLHQQQPLCAGTATRTTTATAATTTTGRPE
ncbi:serine hydrolase [Parahaliea mediterranea]|uniref:serine hydrolase n=1 Tax=Parahaliea mediterranea TaxID=651086 RepID=UPI000E2E6E1A|nr:serine hydrolase [Parahaliea mediterranea]